VSLKDCEIDNLLIGRQKINFEEYAKIEMIENKENGEMELNPYKTRVPDEIGLHVRYQFKLFDDYTYILTCYRRIRWYDSS
jgi:hypothetical protein